MGWLRRKHAGERAEQEKQTHRGGPVPLSPPGLGEGAFTAALPDRGCRPGDVLQVPFRHPDAAAGGLLGVLTAWWGRGQTDDPNCMLPGDTASARAFLEAASPGGGGGRTGWRAAGAGRWPMPSVSGHVRLGSDVPTGALGGLPPRLCAGLEPRPWGRRCGHPSGRG